MATPRNGYAREALENERRAREAARRHEQEKRERRMKTAAGGRARFEDIVRARIQWFDALQPGESLLSFGYPNSVVGKKNRKSVITTTGVKLTRAELTGE